MFSSIPPKRILILFASPPPDIATMPSCRLSYSFFSLYSRYMFSNNH